jgi:hypothetical protein
MNAAVDNVLRFEVGIRSRVPESEYRSLDGISITRLKELQRSPKHYQYRLKSPAKTAPLTLGTAAHVAVLEPERFPSQFAVWSRRSEKTGNLCPRNGQWWEEFEAANASKSIITEDECTTALTLAAAVRGDPVAMKYLETGEPEVTMQWEMRSESQLREPVVVQCRGRADWLTNIDGNPYLIGLKTARDCRPFVFGSAAAKLGYAMQWAYYLDGYRTLTGKTPAVKEIVVESAPPHDVVVYDITDDIIDQGREDYEALLRILTDCQVRNEWLGVGNGTEQILSLPSWAYANQDDISDLGLT